ncbi:MAG: CDP-alcohol phosphatidyltransferase family protein [Verrucomicrobiota bacterium]
MSDRHLGLTLASKVTLVRLAGIPVFVLLMIYFLNSLKTGEADVRYRYGALGLFMFIALTDALDGYLARSRNEVTRLGKMLDPLADKSLLMAGLILMTRPGLPALEPQFPIWFTLLVISRDVFIFAGALILYAHNHRVEVHPRWSGKVATVVTMFAVVYALAGFEARIFFGIVMVAGVLTFISGLQYLLDGIKQYEEGHTDR